MVAAKESRHTITQQLGNAAHSAFLVTLGARVKVQKEVGALLDALVKEGEDIEARMKATIDDGADKLDQANQEPPVRPVETLGYGPS